MLTIWSSELPAASWIAWTLARHCRVCSMMVAPTMAPDAVSNGPCPGTKLSPAACTAWL